MKWTEQVPTENGTYWAKFFDRDGNLEQVTVCRISFWGPDQIVSRGKLFWVMCPGGCDWIFSENNKALWYGPITPPEDNK